MSDAQLQFRTATFGGFQKQDVLNYIETANQEHKEKLESAQRERDEAVQALSGLKEEAAAAREEVQAGLQEQTRLSEEVAKLREELEQVRAELVHKDEALDEAHRELEQVREKLARAEPAAQAYEKVKDRTAGMELEAHCRAQAVQAEAEERVKKVRIEVEQWLGKVQAGYERLRTDMDASVAHACGELDRVRTTLGHISEELGSQDGRLEQLAQACSEALGGRVPAPVPLAEDEPEQKH